MRPAARAMAALAVLVSLVCAGCDDTNRSFQGWVEANLIFVGPDEAGRVETLSVREGDWVEKGAPLLTLDADLQRADLNMTEATFANAQQVFQRAQQLAQDRGGNAEGL